LDKSDRKRVFGDIFKISVFTFPLSFMLFIVID
jgi:hypothetical protein